MAPARTAGSPPSAGACHSGGGHRGATGPMSPPARPGPTDDETRRRASLDMATTTSRPSRFVRLARLCNRHRWRTFLCWLLALVVIQVIASAVGTKQISSFRLPGTESQRAYDLLAEHFPAAKGDTDQVVFRARTGTLTDPATKARIQASLKDVAAAGSVASVDSPFSPGGRLTKNRRIGVATVTYTKSTNDLKPTTLEDVERRAFTARSPTLQVEHGGPGAEVVRFANSQGPSEFVGILAAAVVLLITFGSLVAAGLPLVATLLALGTTLGVITLISHLVDTPDFATQLASLIGLGVGIDYSLFVVTRFRAEVRAGRDRDEAIEVATDTAGRTVMFAAITIIPAMIGGSGNFMDGVLREFDRRGGWRIWGIKRRIPIPGRGWRAR